MLSPLADILISCKTYSVECAPYYFLFKASSAARFFMAPKASIPRFGFSLFACGAVAYCGSVISVNAQTNHQETVLALCETPNHTIRIYQGNGETLMRAYDRQNNVVWMDRTPVSIERTVEGNRYTNLMGEQTVTTLVNTGTGDCSVQLGDNAPEAGALLQTGQADSEALLAEVRQLYPEAVAELEAECQSPSTLMVDSFQNRGEPPRARFVCWSAPDADGERTGNWLGNLPLVEDDPTFVTAFSCSAGDSACEAQLEMLQTDYPDTLKAAEFSCAIKNGNLFLASTDELIDLRCGHFATNYWDTNGDGDPEHSDSISVDESVGQVPL
jgi:hypothetical protein